MLFSVAAMAQNEIDNSYRWYAQAHINGSYSANEDIRRLKFKDALGWGADLAIGYNFNDFWGIYAQVEFNKNRGAQDVSNPLVTAIGTDIKGFKFNTIEPTLNVSYNLSNGFLGYKPGRRNNWYIHAGLGAAFASKNTAVESYIDGFMISPNNHTVMKGSLGINYLYNFNNWIAFTADLTGNILGDWVNGGNWQVPVDGRINLGVGLRVYLTKSTKPTREVVYRDDIIIVHDTIVVDEVVEVSDKDVYPIFFAQNTSEIADSQTNDIKAVADCLKANPAKIVYVLGYAEEGEADDSVLAKTRADKVTDQLINKYGINADRIVTHDMGSNVKPYIRKAEKNRSTICIITELKH